MTGDPGDLVTGLVERRRGVDAEHAARAAAGASSSAAKPAIMPAWVEPVTVHTTMVSKKTSSCLLLLGDLVGPVGEAEAAEVVLGGAGGDAVRLAARLLDVGDRLVPGERMPMSKPEGSRRTSAPMIRDSRMLPTLSLTGSSQSTHFSWTRRHFRPSFAATAATWRVWLDWMPPIETSVSAPCARTSGTMYSSLRVLLPPNARPLLQSSRFAQTWAPPRCCVRRSSGWIGLGPKVSG